MTIIRNQHDKTMETQNTNTTESAAGAEEQKIKTAMISTGAATLETVVQILEDHKITYALLGKDQKNHTVMRLSYETEQQPVIDDIQLIINFVDDAIALFTPLALTFLKAFGYEAELALKKLQDKYGNKKLLALDKLKSNKDGNEERK